MRRLRSIALLVSVVLIAGLAPLSGQTHFRVIGDIPHLPVIVPASILTPEEGMLIFSSTDLKPMIYTGLAWETLCTDNISSITPLEYFVVKSGIPFLPTFSSPPIGTLSSGTIYYSTVKKAMMVFNGTSWIKMIELLSDTIAASNGFSAGVGVKTVKLPVLSSNPAPLGLVAGAFYINSSSRVIRYYDGTSWQDLNCGAIVHTLAVTAVTSNTAMSGGNVTTNGGSAVTLMGICWSPVADPDTLLTSKTRIKATGTGIGIFTSQLTDLLPKTTYHVRAYAVNSLGIVYGEDSILTTPIQPPTIITLDADSITSISALSGGDITFDGGSSITKRGIVWSSLSDPLNDPSQVVTNDGSGVGYFPSTLDALLGLTTYYVRAYAVNAAGTSYGNLVVFTTPVPVLAALNQTLSINNVTENSGVTTGLVLNNGGALVTERGICYTTDQVNYTYLPSSTVNHTDIGTFTVSLSDLQPGITYYVKGYATNSVGTAYSSETSFMTISLPSVLTLRPAFKGNFSAESGGDVTSSGYSTITARGICWSLKRNPTVSLSTKTSEIVPLDGTGTFISELPGLLNDTTYYVRAYAVNAAGIAYGNLDSVYTAPATSAVLTTRPASSVTGVAATSGGIVSYTGNDILSAKGVCWSTGNNPTTGLLTKTSEPLNGLDLGAFGSHLTGLTTGTKYYFRAYAVNSFGTAYGNLDSLFTAVKPQVMTTSPVSVTNISAVGGGFVTSDGNDPVTDRGICWNIFPYPTIADSSATGGSGTGAFVVPLTNLLGSTKYYVRAYALNSVGIAYGNLDSLKTSTPLLGTVTTTGVINIGGTTALGKGTVTSNGGAFAEERGLCWNTTGNATVDGEHVACGPGNGAFSGNLTGLAPNTTYYVRVYVINSVGVNYGNDITFTTFTVATLTTTPASVITSTTAQSGGTIISDGGSTVTASGICWNTTGTPTINDKKTVSGLGIGNFIHILDQLMGSTTYYIRAYATNSAGIAYGNEEFFTTAPPVKPTLTTNAAISDGSGLGGTSGGTITSDGGGVIATDGIVWSTTQGFLPDTVTVNKTVQAGSLGFTSNLVDLKMDSTYYVRAYATNIAGTTYAPNEVSFATYNLPAITTVVPSSVTNVTAISGGNITSTGGAVVTESGICWSTGSMPTIADQLLSDGPGSGLFIRSIPDLMGSTTYYVRAYVKTNVGLVYGHVESFTTQPAVLATILTVQPAATSSTGAISGGNILSHGGSLVTSRGIYWSTQQNFNPDTITLGKTAQTGYFKGIFSAGMSGLLPNTVYYVKAYVVNGVGVSYGDEMSFKSPGLAVLTTAAATSNGSTKGVSGGTITDDGGALISSRGIVWSTAAAFNPDTVLVNKTMDGSGLATFTSRLIGLQGSTTYYVRAYAINMAGTSYGNIVSFITDPAVLVNLTTRSATLVTGTSALSGGTVVNDGGEPITSSGMVWGTSPYFRPDTVVVNKTIQGAAGIGLFTSSITDLSRGTRYYAVAYAVNAIGIAYGDTVSFTTVDFPVVTTLPVYASSDGIQASGGGILVSDGGTPTTSRGVCWSTNPTPTTGLFTKTSNDGLSGGSFHSTLTGLSPVTKYYVRAYAINSQGTAYGNEVSFTTPPVVPSITTIYATPTSSSTVTTGGSITFDGGAPVTARGVLWSTVATFNPDTAMVTKTMNGAGIGNFTSVISNMQLSTSYYIRAYAVNSVGISYGNQITVTIFPTAPILNTNDLTLITGSSALSGGVITSDGGAPVTLKGLCWSTSTNPITSNSHTSNGFGTDAFTATVSDLAPNTLYYVRAYAVNKIGTAYGLEKTFQTNGVPTLSSTTPATNVIATTATSGGTITDDGRTRIFIRGICWSTLSNPSIGLGSKTVDTTAISLGSFSANMKGLTPNTNYYVRSYATNAVGTGYGSQIQFTTLPVMLPSLSTITPFNVDSIKATGGGNIYDDGGMPVTVRGICWSTTPNPTIVLTTKISNATGGDSTYTNTVAGLLPGTKYYVRAYAINSKGTGYGNLDSLTTQAIHATISSLVLSNITQSAVTGTATVLTNGGAPITSRGLCWNTTGIPTIADNLLQDGTGLGSFTDSLTSLVEGPIYYVRAFATNSAGTTYSAVISFRICPTSITVLHVAGLNGAPVTKTVTYGTISSNLTGAARCWITQNLGADQQATSLTDATEASAGWYWQFNRIQGYKHDGTTRTPSTTWVSSISENSDWIPGNDPCNLLLGGGWRIPTSTEWGNVIVNSAGITYGSPLKLHEGGELQSGSLTQRGSYGYIQGSTQKNASSRTSWYYSGNAYTANDNDKAIYAVPLRCLRDTAFITKPSVSDASYSNMTITSVDVSAAVTPDGGSPVTDRGFCWNTTGNPTTADQAVSTGSGLGTFISTLNGLTQGPVYYVRAYAVNGQGLVYSNNVTQFILCPAQFTVQHVAGANGVPVDKTVIYNSISSALSGKAACWLIQNLGADNPASSLTDATEASAGWYWQFNRIQGYKHDGTTRTPSSWVASISENSDWIPGNDPCNLLLGGGWRIPTSTEWGNVIVNTAGVTYGSPLKLHEGGELQSGSLTQRGNYGYIQGSTQNNATSRTSWYYSGNAYTLNNNDKAIYAVPLRCLRDTAFITAPSVSNVTISGATQNSMNVTAAVTPDGGAPVTDRGFCWNTTGNPVITDNPVSNGTGTGSFTSTLNGLTGGSYYVRAYATNSVGTAYSQVSAGFKVCPPSFTVNHTAGVNGAPVSKTVTYHSVNTNLSGAAKCWLTQNLGADQQASAVNDNTESSAGWYWQFNRSRGYQYTNVRTPASPWIGDISESSDWLPPNDPCTLMIGPGWRIPTVTEWTNVDGAPQNWGNSANAYASVLNLHDAGYIDWSTAVIGYRGSSGYYWSSSQTSSGNAYDLSFNSTLSSVSNSSKANSFSLRCICDTILLTVSDVVVPAATMTANASIGTATVTSDGGASITTRGLCWNTTGNPTVSDQTVSTGSGLGIISETLSGLIEGPTYYVRAFASNATGTAYSPDVTGFKICNPFTVIHVAGLNGAPVSKTVTYQTVSSTMSGAPLCWLAQNLGADQQATSVSDNTEPSAGWYWQFNKLQGYKHDGTTRTPNNAWTPWITAITENSNWQQANDPCSVMLGLGWRIPTLSEWTNVDGAPQFWNNSADIFASVLKLHMAGDLAVADGTLVNRGSYGYYWSSTQSSTTNGNEFWFNSSTSTMGTYSKAYPFAVRCLRDTIIISTPAVSVVNIPAATMTAVSATGAATISPDGGAPVTSRGLCWNTNGNPTIADNLLDCGTGTGIISATLTGLVQGPTYYVRAYATNTKGTSYSPVTSSFKICPTNFTVTHNAGVNGAPITKTVTYNSISSSISGAASCWLSQNLGADQAPSAVNDATEPSGGWYWQFNRAQGYQYSAARVPASAWNASISESSNWLPANDPCTLLLGSWWHIPTLSDWTNADAPPQNWSTSADAFASVLNLHQAGYFLAASGAISNRGSYGYYWSSTQSSASNGNELYFYNSASTVTNSAKANAFSVRCICDTVLLSVSDVAIPVSNMTATSATGSYIVYSDGGSPLSSRGLCWNTTGNPTIADNIVSTGSGLGSISETITGLVEGPTYYVRAYATNATGTAYSPLVNSFKICNPFTVIHIAGLNGAPVSKTVTYQTVSTGISGAPRCWLAQNLGADHPATAANDNTEPSAGWYWQFNRLQGYKHDGTTRTPNNSWVPWITTITESSDWQSVNDPCSVLLGSGWRIPTLTEWINADGAPQFWNTSADAFASVLKLHMAGDLAPADGSLINRGSYGYYWSSSQSSTTNGNEFWINSSTSIMGTYSKAYPFAVRCLRDLIVIAAPSVSVVDIPTSTMTSNSATGSATVTPDGGAPVTARGLCWNTTGTPTIADNILDCGTGIGVISATLTGLLQEPTYYVRAYATNSAGTTYSPAVSSFKICLTTFTVNHTAGVNGAPVTKTVTYHSISSTLSGAAKCWLTQNLGADQQASAVNDATESSAGWYWQYNRSRGYQYTSVRTPASAWIGTITETSDWLPANDPCLLLLGTGWRIPTIIEWTNVNAPPQNWKTSADAFASQLKLHSAGYIDAVTAVVTYRSTSGYFWANTQFSSTNGNLFDFNTAVSTITSSGKANAFSLRCINDGVVFSVGDVAFPTSAMTASTATGSAMVYSDGGAPITSRGLCWNTTGTPTISDNVVSTGSGVGTISETLTGLTEDPTYYVRAYATNSTGTVYSPDVTSFKICNPFTVIHVAGLNGAPVSKTVTYQTVSTNISGAPRCWLAQNLGADQQPTAVNDVTEPSAGWYFEFNRLQGYQYTTVRTPNYAWVVWPATITENSDWQSVNDPCAVMLGSGWRIPTSTEWINANGTPQFWNTAADAFASVLKLHEAGCLDASVSGTIATRGTYGDIWSSTQFSTTNGNFMQISSTTSVSNTSSSKANGFSVRCLRDMLVPVAPSVSVVDIPTATMTSNSATGSATVSPDGGAPVTARGLCWNTTGTPTTADNILDCGTGTGVISATLTGLVQGPTYYVRAYATNSVGTTYGAVVSSFKICLTTFTVNHTAGVNGAPVTKTVTYHSISSSLSGAAKCWLTQNLGADQQASAVNDATESSAGWYWQFNRSRGYQYTTVRTPASTWIGTITETSDWLPANDPCLLLLGTGWRIPTVTEWTNADAPPQNWGTSADAFASPLKLHSAGYIDAVTAVVTYRSTSGYFWANTQFSSTNGNMFDFNTLISNVTSSGKANAFSLRCISDGVLLSVSDPVFPTSAMTATTATGSATVYSDGGAAITSRGLCWNTTGTPTITDQTVSTGNGVGSISETLTGLVEGPTYFVRAYATNSTGTVYSPDVTSFKICNPFTVIHVAGLNGAPVSKTVTYQTISSNISGAPRCWLAQNLGADQQATAVTDNTEPSAGWYFEFNRLQGYQYTTVRTPNYPWVVWPATITESSDWASVNDPCSVMLGSGWRIPTLTEWTNAKGTPQFWNIAADAFASVLKLHEAGDLDASASGTITSRGTYGDVWSSTQSSTTNGNFLQFNSTTNVLSTTSKANGLPVRCLRDLLVPVAPSVSVVDIPTATMTGSSATGTATVSPDGGAPVTSRGLCWNTTGTPTTADNILDCGTGTGVISATLNGLVQGPTYYVRAYAVNSTGITYSQTVSSFMICPTTFAVSHTAGINGAPVTKTVTYHSISSTISGAAKCWLTQNLGADQQASAVNDATESSAGWYWQFNRSKGYQYTTVRTPSSAWITTISETSDWASANDPCLLLLGTGWRIPTATEWTNADAQPQYWTTMNDAFASVLKLHNAGDLAAANGAITNRSTYGYYWSSTQSTAGNGNELYFFSTTSMVTNSAKANAFSLRCLKDY